MYKVVNCLIISSDRRNCLREKHASIFNRSFLVLSICIRLKCAIEIWNRRIFWLISREILRLLISVCRICIIKGRVCRRRAGVHAMRLLRLFQVSHMSHSHMIFGAVESLYLLWWQGICRSKIKMYKLYIKKSQLASQLTPTTSQKMPKTFWSSSCKQNRTNE